MTLQPGRGGEERSVESSAPISPLRSAAIWCAAAAVVPGTGDVPAGLLEQSPTQLFRDLAAHFSHCQTQRVKKQIFDMFFLLLLLPWNAHVLCCTTGYSLTLSVNNKKKYIYYFYKNTPGSFKCSCLTTDNNSPISSNSDGFFSPQAKDNI